MVRLSANSIEAILWGKCGHMPKYLPRDDNSFQVRGVFGDFKVRMQKSALQLKNVIITPHPLGGGVE